MDKNRSSCLNDPLRLQDARDVPSQGRRSEASRAAHGSAARAEQGLQPGRRGGSAHHNRIAERIRQSSGGHWVPIYCGRHHLCSRQLCRYLVGLPPTSSPRLCLSALSLFLGRYCVCMQCPTAVLSLLSKS